MGKLIITKISLLVKNLSKVINGRENNKGVLFNCPGRVQPLNQITVIKLEGRKNHTFKVFKSLLNI